MGHVILKASQQVQTLMDLKIKRIYKAKSGEPGKKKNMFGANGANEIIKVPCGTLIFDEEQNLIGDLKTNNQEIIIANGGKGGLGNSSFSTSTNQVPRYAQPGLPGEEKTITLELRVIADVGLIGLPNAGKSTLLKVLTSANPKIGAYPFTTLFPNLGVIRYLQNDIVIADIPGLIEGASKGQGLGDEFLRHVDRTRLLLHLVDISLDSEESCFNNYELVQHEISQHNLNVHKKPMIVVLTKTDIIETEKLDKVKTYFKKKNIETLSISSTINSNIDQLKEVILKHITELNK